LGTSFEIGKQSSFDEGKSTPPLALRLAESFLLSRSCSGTFFLRTLLTLKVDVAVGFDGGCHMLICNPFAAGDLLKEVTNWEDMILDA
jgi:hypothetical protein